MLSLQRIALALAVAVPALAAQEENSQDELQQRYQQKLAAPFVGHVGWVDELAAVRGASAAEGKYVFAYFSRSYSP